MPIPSCRRKKNDIIKFDVSLINIELDLEITETLPALNKFLCPEHLEFIARKTGFVERQWHTNAVSKLTLAAIAAVLNGSGITVPSVQAHLFGMTGLDVSRISIWNHFKKPQFGLFLRELLTKPLNSLPAQELGGWLKLFSNVYIYDTSSWQLPENGNLQQIYPSTGGNASLAAIKVAAQLNFNEHNFPDVKLFAQKARDKITMFDLDIEPQSLQLFDLGFFSVKALKEIAAKKAFYIFRFRYGTVLCRKDKRLGLEDLAVEVGDVLDLDLTATNEKLPVRLTVEKLPCDAFDKRLAHLTTQAQKHNRKVSADQIEWARYNMFLTNVTRDLVAGEGISVLYTLRWQIEIVFKVLKSLLRLGRDYWRDEILIQNAIYAVFLTYQTITMWAEEIRRSCSFEIKELSPWLLIKHFSWLFLLWLYLEMNPCLTTKEFFERMIIRCLEFCQKDDRKKRPSTLSKLEKEISYAMLKKIS